MVQQLPARVGDELSEVDTPTLIVDLDAYERNLGLMASIVGDSGKAFRPHAKTHKSPVIALDQMALGAVGVCCQKLSEAEILWQGGVRDILIANEVVGELKQRRLAKLARSMRLTVCVDDIENLRSLNQAAEEADSIVSVLVEVDVGGGRCGVTPNEAGNLAAAAADSPALRFAGIQAYHGSAQHLRSVQERQSVVAKAANLAESAKAEIEARGLVCQTVTGGGTGTLLQDIEHPIWTELQCGSYIFMDADYGRNRDARGAPYALFENSLFVLSSVMSVAHSGKAILDAGLKALAFDSGPPTVADRSDFIYSGPSDEHGTLTVPAHEKLALGDRVRLIPGHCDPTVNLYDWFVGVRNDRVERIWPVAARGALS